MKFMRIGPPGAEIPAVAVGQAHFVDIGDLASDVDGDLLARDHADVRALVGDRVRRGALHELAGNRIGPPLARPHQVLCIGLNYRDHAAEAAEAGQVLAGEPVVFGKSPNTLAGPGDAILRPPGSAKLDYEVEIGLVVGRRAQYLTTDAEAFAAIAGLVVVNDVSEREYQFERGGQWAKGKSAQSFNPCGPVLTTVDDVGDLAAIGLWLDVNGERRQQANTRDMIVGLVPLVRYLSQFFVLEPGDLINTGTPAGVGGAMQPPRYLEPGDRVVAGADGLGQISSTIEQFGVEPG